MKVLLCQDIEKLGWFGDVVEVKTGYARNFLLPQGLAVVPSEANIKAQAAEKAKRSEERIQNRKRLEAVAAAVNGAEAVISAKANEQGVLFGSVGPKEVAENLRTQGFEVADVVVQLHEHIKQVGSSEVKLKFADDLASTVKVTVVALSEAAQEAEAAPEA